MPETIGWSSNLAVTGGPKLSAAQTLSVTAYDKVQVTIPGENKPNDAEPMSHGDNAAMTVTAVDVQPAAGSDRLQLLAITADRYGADLVYGVAGGAENVALDAPQMLVGRGAIGLLGANPETLSFKNGLGEDYDATVTILVGRQATAP